MNGDPWPGWSAQAGFDVRLSWGAVGAQALREEVGTLIIVDVLRFTTALDVATSRGAQVLPARWPHVVGDHDEGGAVGGAGEVAEVADGTGPRRLSLSPATLTGLGPGDRIVLPSANGSHCCAEAVGGPPAVVGGCLRNADAVARWHLAHGGGAPVAVVPCGERWPDGSLRPAVEDLVGAGAIVSVFETSGLVPSPEAMVAAAAYRAAAPEIGAFLAASVSGRELSVKNHEDDVAWAAALGVSRCVPVLGAGGAFSEWHAGGP